MAADTHICWMLTLVIQVVLLTWLQIQTRTRLCSGNISIHSRGNGALSQSTSPRLTVPLRHHHLLWNSWVQYHTGAISAYNSTGYPSLQSTVWLGYGLGDQRFAPRQGKTDISINVHISSGAHPISDSVTRSVTGDKADRAWSWPFIYIYCRG